MPPESQPRDPRLPGARPEANFLWLLAGSVIFAASQWGVLIALARAGTPRLVGQFSLGLAICAPIITFANLKLRAVLATDSRDEYGFRDYLSLRVRTTLAALLVIGLVAGLAYSRETATIIVAIGVAKAFEAISDISYGAMQQSERMRSVAVSLTIRGGFGLAAIAAVVWYSGSLTLGVLSVAAAWAVVGARDVGVAARLSRARGRSPGESRKSLWTLATTVAPLGFVTALGALHANIPRYFVEAEWGSEALGIFAAMAYLLVAGSMVVAALGQAASPRLAEAFGRGDTGEFRRVLGWLLALGAGLGLLGVVVAAFASGPILTLLYGADYATHSRTLVWLMVAAGVTYAYVFLGTAATAMRRFRIQLPIELAGMLVVLAASSIMVPRWGLLGAAWALCASAGTLACLYFLVVGRAIVRGDDRPLQRRPARAGEPPGVGEGEP